MWIYIKTKAQMKAEGLSFSRITDIREGWNSSGWMEYLHGTFQEADGTDRFGNNPSRFSYKVKKRPYGGSYWFVNNTDAVAVDIEGGR